MVVQKAVMCPFKLLRQYLSEGNEKTKHSTDFWADTWTEYLSKMKKNG
jgi:hypothetical protein